MESTSWMQVAALLYLVLSLGVLAGVFLLLRGMVRLLAGTGEPGKRSLLGGDARTRLLGLAITTIFFTPLLGRLVRGFIRLAILLFDRVPRHMLARWRDQADFCQDSGAACVTDTVLLLVNATAGGVTAALRDSGLLGIEFGLVVLWLALWVLATATLNVVAANADPGEPFEFRRMLVGREHEVTRQNFLFFAVLLVGAYLSLASIAAIPDLRVDRETRGPDTARGTQPKSLRVAAWLADIKKDAVPDPLRLVDSVLYPTLGAPDTASAAAPPDTTPRPAAGPGIRLRNPPPAPARPPAQDSAAAAAQPPAPAEAQAASVAAGAGAAEAGGSVDTLAAAASPGGNRLAISPRVPPGDVAAIHTLAIQLRALWHQQSVRHDSIARMVSRNSEALARALSITDTTRQLRDQRMYFQRLDRWWTENDARLRAAYDNSLMNLRRLQRHLEGWSTAAAGYLTRPAPDSVPTGRPVSRADSARILRPARDADSMQVAALAREATRIRSESSLQPQPEPLAVGRPPERGEGLGPFQYVSGWLLKTDSMPLTLIVGMLGFGLLGAAASTFVRDQTMRQKQEAEAEKAAAGGSHAASGEDVKKESEKLIRRPAQPLVRNLPSVVIRGGSAAIVVFLGIMGGLSVFTQEADPNPYALLFTCLVGAVFSEQVWVWAEKRFGMNMDGAKEDEGAADDEGATRASRVYVVVAKPSDVVMVREDPVDEAASSNVEEAAAAVVEVVHTAAQRRRGGFLGRVLNRRRRRPAPEPPPASDTAEE